MGLGRRLLFFLLWSVSGLMLAFSFLPLFLFRTEKGLHLLEYGINQLLKQEDGSGVRISGLEGALPFDIRIQNLTIRDREADFFQARDLHLLLSAQDLFSGRIGVHTLQGKNLTLHRLPLPSPKEGPNPSPKNEGFSLPALPPFFIETLDIREIVIAEAVAGEHLRLHLGGNAAADSQGIRALMALNTLEGPALSLNLEARLLPEKENLHLAIRFEDSEGRLTALLGQPDHPLHLTLSGEGSPSHWQGHLTLQSGSTHTLLSRVDLGLGKTPFLDLEGRFTLNPQHLPAPLSLLLEKGEVKARISRKENGNLHLETLNLHTPSLSLQGQGELTPENLHLNTGLALTLLQPRSLGDWLGLDLGPQVRLNLTARGPLTRPETDFELLLGHARAGDLSLQRLTLKGQLSLIPEKGALAELVCTARLKAEGAAFPDLPLPPSLETELRLAYGVAEQQLRIHELTLKGKDLSLNAKGQWNTHANTLEARLGLDVRQLGPWLQASGLKGIEGKGQLQAEVQGSLSPPALHLSLKAGLTAIHGLPAPLEHLGGDPLTLRSSLVLGPESGDPPSLSLRVTELALEGSAFRLQGEGAISLASQDFQGKIRLHLPELQPLHESLLGTADLSLTAEGQPQDFRLTATLDSEAVGGFSSESLPLHLSLHATHLPAGPEGELSFQSRFRNLDLKGTTGFSLRETSLSFTEGLLELPGIRISHGGTLDLKSLMLRADIQGHLDDPAPLARLGGLDIQGKGSFLLHLFPGEKGQDASLDMTLSGLSLENLHLASLHLNGDFRNVLTDPALDLSLHVKNLSSGEMSLGESRSHIHGTIQALFLESHLLGRIKAPFDIQLQARYARKEDTHELRLKTLEGNWGTRPLLLDHPWLLRQEEGRLLLDPLALRLDTAQLTLKGFLARDNSLLELDIRDFPMAVLGLGLAGQTDARLHLLGPLHRPEITLEIQGDNLCPKAPEDRHLPLMRLAAEARLREGSLRIHSRIHNMETGENVLNMRGQLPLLLSLQPFSFSLDRHAALEGQLSGTLDFSRISLFFMPESQILKGLAHLDLTLNGTLDKPLPGGTIRLREGVYQHLGLGLNIRKLEGDLIVDGETVYTRNLKAGDGNGGTLSGEGRIGLSSEAHFPFSLSVNAQNMKAMQTDTVNAVLARGEASYEGTLEKQHVTGELFFDRVEVFLGEFGGPEVAELAVTEINGENGTVRGNGNGIHREDSSHSLDLKLHFPARIFVRGRGLDSEWGGRLAVSRNASSPVIRGDIALIRGRMDFLGKRLSLSQGNIMLDGSQPPRPFVSFEARQEGKEIVSILRVEGQPPNLNFLLSSEPALPQDEVLANMLFGRSLATITPIQAAQLALAARELAGKGGGPGALGTARNLLRLDDLNLVSDGDSNDDIRLRAGKYVHERVYLRVEKDLKTDDDLVSADVELTRSITLESTLGPKGGGMGLFWKRDY